MNDRVLDPLRKFKNNLIHQYYQFRINSIQDPYKIKFRKKPYKILLILSHMRSGSSLLTHILNSNPEIIGYGETHINYTSEADFKILMLKVYSQLNGLEMKHQYILDKVLHNHKFLSCEFLGSEQVQVIFLIREPQRTLSSILDIKPHWIEDKALDYYVSRLSKLEDYAQKINNKQRSLAITYDQLVNHTDLVFRNLQIFLKTQAGFSENYQILKTTGMKGIGDSSENIKAGCIIRTHQLETKVSPELIQKAGQPFSKCYKNLSYYCRII
jgi:hypothetical protein